MNPIAPEEPAAIELDPFTNEVMQISGVIPRGWKEIAPSVHAHTNNPIEVTKIIQQSAAYVEEAV